MIANITINNGGMIKNGYTRLTDLFTYDQKETRPMTKRTFNSEHFLRQVHGQLSEVWYEFWEARFGHGVDGFVKDMYAGTNLYDSCYKNSITRYDVAMGVRFGAFTDQEIEDLGLEEVARSIKF